MAVITRVHGKITKSKVMDSMCGAMADLIREIGKTIKCMDSECMFGKTVGNTKEIMPTTKSKARANITGQMESVSKDDGSMENDKALVKSSLSPANPKLAFGRTTKRSNGSPRNKSKKSLIPQTRDQGSSRNYHKERGAVAAVTKRI